MTREFDHILVEGNSSIEVVPDLAGFRVSVRVVSEKAADAKAIVEEKILEVSTVLDRCSVEKSLIVARNISIRENKIRDGADWKIEGMVVSREIHISNLDLSRFLKTIELISKIEYASIPSTVFSYSKSEVLQKDLLVQALENAKSKAEIVAEASGRILGKLHYANISPKQKYVYDGGTSTDFMDSQNSNIVFEPGVIKQSESIEVVYHLG